MRLAEQHPVGSLGIMEEKGEDHIWRPVGRDVELHKGIKQGKNKGKREGRNTILEVQRRTDSYFDNKKKAVEAARAME